MSVNECCAARPISPSGSGWVLSLLTVLLLTAGCGEEDFVRGQVTLDGKPLAQGSIRFIPSQRGQGTAVGGKITDGWYSLSGKAFPAVGSNRVEIRANRKTGQMVQDPYGPPGEMMETSEQAVATEYNDESTLKFEVKPGANEANWEVESRELE